MESFPTPVLPGAFGLPGWMFLVLQAGYLPFAAWRGRARARALTRYPSRAAWSLRVVVTQALLLTFSLAVARYHDLRLLAPEPPRPLDLAIGVAFLAVLLAIAVPMWRDAVRRRVPRLYFVMPQTAGDKAWWLARSAAAGFGEEITYRGVLFALLAGLTGSIAAAVVLQAAVFALVHLNQERRAVAFIFALSIAMQLLVLRSGSLWVAMGVHFLYDAIAGFTYTALGRRDGYPPEGVPLEPAAATSPVVLETDV